MKRRIVHIKDLPLKQPEPVSEEDFNKEKPELVRSFTYRSPVCPHEITVAMRPELATQAIHDYCPHCGISHSFFRVDEPVNDLQVPYDCPVCREVIRQSTDVPFLFHRCPNGCGLVRFRQITDEEAVQRNQQPVLPVGQAVSTEGLGELRHLIESRSITFPEWQVTTQPGEWVALDREREVEPAFEEERRRQSLALRIAQRAINPMPAIIPPVHARFQLDEVNHEALSRFFPERENRPSYENTSRSLEQIIEAAFSEEDRERARRVLAREIDELHVVRELPDGLLTAVFQTVEGTLSYANRVIQALYHDAAIDAGRVMLLCSLQAPRTQVSIRDISFERRRSIERRSHIYRLTVRLQLLP